MSSLCTAALISFSGDPLSVTITNKDYNCMNFNGPPLLIITIINTEKNNYEIKLGDKIITLTFDPFAKIWDYESTNTNLAILLSNDGKYMPQKCNNREITDGEINVFFTIPFELYKDTYSILINDCINRIRKGVSVIFTRIFDTSINSNQLRSNTINKISEVEIPYINISGQTLIDFSDVGNMIFTIGDKFSYYKEQPLHNTKCITPYPINSEQLKLTIFNKSCSLMVSVLRGEGSTLLEKANSIYPDKATFPTFYTNLILYGMLKFILSRILYGKFDINFLLRKYNEKFLKDLGSSRFCSFLEIFVDPTSQIFGYNQYFRYNLKK
jgi:hypothetical protein